MLYDKIPEQYGAGRPRKFVRVMTLYGLKWVAEADWNKRFKRDRRGRPPKRKT